MKIVVNGNMEVDEHGWRMANEKGLWGNWHTSKAEDELRFIMSSNSVKTVDVKESE